LSEPDPVEANNRTAAQQPPIYIKPKQSHRTDVDLTVINGAIHHRGKRFDGIILV
jgi:hypothetical protein